MEANKTELLSFFRLLSSGLDTNKVQRRLHRDYNKLASKWHYQRWWFIATGNLVTQKHVNDGLASLHSDPREFKSHFPHSLPSSIIAQRSWYWKRFQMTHIPKHLSWLIFLRLVCWHLRLDDEKNLKFKAKNAWNFCLSLAEMKEARVCHSVVIKKVSLFTNFLGLYWISLCFVRQQPLFAARRLAHQIVWGH